MRRFLDYVLGIIAWACIAVILGAGTWAGWQFAAHLRVVWVP